MAGQLSPLGIGRSLSPANGSLTELIIHGSKQHWESQDTTRIDLSSFKSLKVLSMPWFLVFDSSDPDSIGNRNGVYKLLPSGLVDLRIFFGWTAGVLYNSEQQFHDFQNGKMPETTYFWLTELSFHKTNRFPQLKTVQVWEATESLDTPENSPVVEWSCSCLSEQFQERGVILKVVLRLGHCPMLPRRRMGAYRPFRHQGEHELPSVDLG